MPELHVLRGDEVVHVRPIGRTPVHIGRAPTNDLVLTDRQISARHAVVWVEGGEIRAEDLGSRNGTFVNDKQITAPTAVKDGDVLRLGTHTRLRVRGEVADQGDVRLLGALFVEDVDAGIRHALRSDRFRVGSGDDADLRLPDGPDRAATLLVHENGEIWLGTDEEDRQLDVDQPFEVGGRRLCVRESSDAVSRTEGVESTTYPYRLKVTLEGATGPEALFEDPRNGRTYRVGTENRATLLYLLARQRKKDRDEGLADAESGWCADDDVAVGVWGRDKNKLDPNNYHVLVCRLRKELREAGFDAWFIEKRRKHIRLRLADLDVAG